MVMDRIEMAHDYYIVVYPLYDEVIRLNMLMSTQALIIINKMRRMKMTNDLKTKLDELNELNGEELLKAYKYFNYENEPLEYLIAVLQKIEGFDFGDGVNTRQANAIFELAKFYKIGNCVMRNFNTYRDLVLRAAWQGHISALYELSTFHIYGDYGFKKDDVMGWKIWDYLKRFGHKQSIKNLITDLKKRDKLDESDDIYKLELLLKSNSYYEKEFENHHDYNHVVTIQEEAGKYDAEIKARVAERVVDNVIIDFEGWAPYFEYDGMGS